MSHSARTDQDGVIHSNQKVIFPLHGIRTRGIWQDDLQDMSHERGWSCRMRKWSFGKFNLFQFLWPLSRKAKVKWFHDTYLSESAELRLDGSSRPCVVAHSFGTYILGNALLRYEFLKLDKVILCGSILPLDFPWDTLIERGQVRAVRNEYGVEDIWVRLVDWFVPATGPSGYYGFACKHPCLVQERFDYTHSEYFSKGHMEEKWFPFLGKTFPGVAPDTRYAMRPLKYSKPVPLYTLYVLLFFALIMSGIVWLKTTIPKIDSANMATEKQPPATQSNDAIEVTKKVVKQESTAPADKTIPSGPSRISRSVRNDLLSDLSAGNSIKKPQFPHGVTNQKTLIGTWIIGPDMLRSGYLAGPVGAVLEGKFYVIGGRTRLPGTGTELEIYDPGTNAWTYGTRVPSGISAHGVAVYNRSIYCFGGTAADDDNWWGRPINNAYRYDPDTGVWTSLPDMPHARSDFLTAVIGDKIYCVGGATGWPRTIKAVDVYDPTTNNWSKAADMPVGRGDPKGGVYKNKIVSAYGFIDAQHSNENTADKQILQFDPAANAWSVIGKVADSGFGRENCFLFSNDNGMYFAGSRSGHPFETWISLFHPETGDVEYLIKAPSNRYVEASGFDEDTSTIYLAHGSIDGGKVPTFEYIMLSTVREFRAATTDVANSEKSN